MSNRPAEHALENMRVERENNEKRNNEKQRIQMKSNCEAPALLPDSPALLPDILLVSWMFRRRRSSKCCLVLDLKMTEIKMICFYNRTCTLDTSSYSSVVASNSAVLCEILGLR